MKLQIVKTTQGYVAISDEPKKEGQHFACVNQLKTTGYVSIHTDYNMADICCYPIIATDTTFKLEGIPQFELEKSPLREELRDIIAEDWYKHKDDEPYIEQTADDCYKAAQSKGCFTEEDMNWVANMASGMAYSGKTSSEIANQLTIKINSLKQPKKLVAIEVGTRLALAGYNEKGNAYMKEVFKMIESEQYPDGLLTIKQYYYE